MTYEDEADKQDDQQKLINLDLFPNVDPSQQIPDGCKFSQTEDSMYFSLPWAYRGMLLGMVILCLALILGWFSMVSMRLDLLGKFTLLGTGLLAAGAAASLYAGLAFMLNKTIIWVNKEKIIKKIAPLPWGQHRTIWREKVSQFYIREVVLPTPQGGLPRLAYNVEMMGNKLVKDCLFIKQLPNPDLAKFIEYKLETFWNITNQSVSGEYIPMQNPIVQNRNHLLHRIADYFGISR